MLKELIRNVDDVPERYQRFALHAFIERVEIFEERQKKNKLWVKHIKFRIPMTRVEDGEEVWGFDFPDDEHDESFLPPKDRHVETVCLLSKLSEVNNHISVKVDMDEMDVTAPETPKEKEDAIIEAFRHFQMI